MKVLHVIPSLSEVHGGPTRALAAMERALVALGVEVDTASTDDDGPGRRAAKPSGVPLRENGATHWYFRKAFDFYKPAPSFGRWIRHSVRRYDVVHIHALFSYTSVVAARAARDAGVPYVLRPLGTLNQYGMKQRRPLAKRLSLRMVEGPLLRDAAAVHFTSEHEAREARSLGIRCKESIIPLGVEPVFTNGPAPAGTGEHLTVLFLSRLDPKKNLEALLDAIASLGLDGELRLLVAGSGDVPYVTSLRERARRLGIEGRVHWLGHVEGERKADALARADVFVLPSFSENFGIAAVEALAAGRPCVLGEGVAIAAQVGAAGAGIAVAPTPVAIADALRRIMDEPDQLRAMADCATRLARDAYSPQAMGARLVELYRGCARR